MAAEIPDSECALGCRGNIPRVIQGKFALRVGDNLTVLSGSLAIEDENGFADEFTRRCLDCIDGQ